MYSPPSPSETRAETLHALFTYHPVTNGSDRQRLQSIRDAAKHLAEVILNNTPPCADQRAAIRKVREAVMTANASIVLGGFGL